MNRGQIKAMFRASASDDAVLANGGVAPRLWSEPELDAMADEAVLEACRRAHLLVDSSSVAARGTVVATEPTLSLDSRVIFIRRARLASASVPLVIRTARDMDEMSPGWENARPSTPSVLIPDWETGAVRLYPPPLIDDTLVMTVVREPLAGMTDDADEPELPKRYHPALVHWLTHKAFLKLDTETLDKTRSADGLAMFEAEFGPKSRAIDEHWAREQYYNVGDFQ